MTKQKLSIPYFETTRYRVETMIRLSNPSSTDRVADLGSGDGRISIAFAMGGCHVDAYEIDELLIAKSAANIKDLGLSRKIELHKQNFWDVELSHYDIVCIYPMPDIMGELEEKLRNELAPGKRVLTNFYTFPEWKHSKTENKIYLYET